jgi:hypothetical protein
MLHEQSALKELAAVEAGAEDEVSLQERIRFAEEVEDFCRHQVVNLKKARRRGQPVSDVPAYAAQ